MISNKTAFNILEKEKLPLVDLLAVLLLWANKSSWSYS